MNYLADTSAIHLIMNDTDNHLGWDDTVEAGLVGVCDVTELEFMRSSKSTRHATRLRTAVNGAFPWVAMPDDVYRRAKEVQQILIRNGEHRSAGPVDLMVAATAELSGLTLLHRDRDCETIAKHTQQPTAMIATQ